MSTISAISTLNAVSTTDKNNVETTAIASTAIDNTDIVNNDIVNSTDIMLTTTGGPSTSQTSMVVVTWISMLTLCLLICNVVFI